MNNAVGPGEEQIVAAINVRFCDDGPMHAWIIDPLYFRKISVRRGVKSWHSGVVLSSSPRREGTLEQ